MRVAGTISIRGNLLSLEFLVEGDLSRLSLPDPVETPERRGRLWEETCLELFLAEKSSESYLEFNFSPAGSWNVYRFASYRDGMREEEAIGSLPFRVETERELLRLSLALDIGELLPGGGNIEAGICAVLRTDAGGTSHWALAHPGPRPDFHHRGGFILEKFI